MFRDPREEGEPGRLDLEAMFTSVSNLPLREVFPELPLDIWTEEFFRANELLNLYTDFRVWTVLSRMGLEPGEPLSTDPGCLVRLGMAPARRDSAAWLLAKASRSSFVRAPESPGEAGSPVGEFSLTGLRSDYGTRLTEEILGDNPALAPCLKLADLASAGYPAFLRGEIEGRAILFSPEVHDVWESYFDRKNPFYQPVNYLAAHASRLAAAGGAPAVLELGAGCGSGTVTLLEELAGTPPARYVATDISASFLRKARARVEEMSARERAGVEFRLLDLNSPRPSWRLTDGEFDLVFAVNALHCARDLVATLRALRQLLRVGGLLVLGECLRPERSQPVHPEFAFQLLDEFRDVQGHPAHRPGWGFLDAAGWRGALVEAGFREPSLLPDAVARGFREQSIAAIVARA